MKIPFFLESKVQWLKSKSWKMERFGSMLISLGFLLGCIATVAKSHPFCKTQNVMEFNFAIQKMFYKHATVTDKTILFVIGTITLSSLSKKTKVAIEDYFYESIFSRLLKKTIGAFYLIAASIATEGLMEIVF